MKKIYQQNQQSAPEPDNIDFTGGTQIILPLEVPFLPPQTLQKPEEAITG